MEEFIRNFRRVPRVPVRLRVTVSSVGGDFIAQTEDVGPGGCRLLCPYLVAVGDLVRLSIECDAFTEALKVVGKVVWASTRTRLRAGVQYDDVSRPAAETWFARFLECHPAIAARLSKVPKLLPYSTLLYPTAEALAPQVHTEEERALYAQIRPGMTVRDVVGQEPARLRDRSNAIFALIATKALTIQTGDFRPRAEQPPRQPATTATPGARPRELRTPAPGARAAPPAGPPRSPEAQEKFERAQRLAAEGRMSEAIPLLRDALKMSPRDAAIAALLARAAFGGGGG